MLTSGQCVVAAYQTEGDIICPKCADKVIMYDIELEREKREAALAESEGRDLRWHEEREILDECVEEFRARMRDEGLSEIIQYSLDEYDQEGEGVYCGHCGEVLVEPVEIEDDEDEQDSDDGVTELDEPKEV